MQSIVHEHVSTWDDVEDIYVGCSGNFTVERALADLKPAKGSHGNDVTLYSCAVGNFLAHQPLDLHIRPETAARYPWLAEEVEDGDSLSVVSTVLLLTRFAFAFGKEHQTYYARLVAGYRDQWHGLMETTRDRLRRVAFVLNTFTPMDVVDWTQTVPAASGVICYPPFQGGDYESQNAPLDHVFDWPMPAFTMFDDARLAELIGSMRTKRRWLLGTKSRLEGMDAALRGVTRTTNRGVPIFVYSSSGPRRHVQPRQPVEQVLMPRLARGDVVGQRMALHLLKEGQFVTLRSQYMNANIRPGQPTIAVGVSVDGHIVGAFAMAVPSATANWSGKLTPPWCYLLSDFPVSGTDYPRLSKLVLYAALSKEARRLIERSLSHRTNSIATTAFAKNPVSMKYRGMFKVLNRRQLDDGRYEINYGSDLGRWTLAEGLAEWRRKHAAVTAKEAA